MAERRNEIECPSCGRIEQYTDADAELGVITCQGLDCMVAIELPDFQDHPTQGAVLSKRGGK